MPQQNVTVYVSNLPVNSVIMWYGIKADVPANWSLCDGTNGTPNLQDRFVVGAGSNYTKGATGGEATHLLSIAEMPSHTHALRMDGTWQVPNAGNFHNVVSPKPGSLATQATGGGAAHNNIPPYFALYYIMKTA